MKKLAISAILFSAMLATIGASALQQSYAHNPDNIAIPVECPQFVGDAITNKVHDVNILNVGNINPGDDVTAEASFQGTSAVDTVRFVWKDGTGTTVQVADVPKPLIGSTWSVQDTFNSVYGPNTEWTVIACFISEHHTADVNNLHIDVTSFFVLPEAAIGAIAIVGSSLAAFGGYSMLRNKKSVKA